ncbi:hypothetical protein D3C80_1676290 [compost metagenome]
MPALEHIDPDGKEGFRDCCRLRQAHVLGHRQRIALMHFAVFGIAAAGNQGAHAIAWGIILYPNADSNHFAGYFQTGDIRCAGWRRVLATALHHVRPVNPGGGDLHQNLTLLQRRQWPFGDNQHFRFAWLADFDRFHGIGQWWVC